MWIEWTHLRRQFESVENHHKLSKEKEKSGLSDFSASIRQGITVVLGPAGSGKSTLLQLTAMLSVPDDGRITYCNEKGAQVVWSKGSANTSCYTKLYETKDQIGYIPSTMRFHYHMKVEEELLQLAQIRRLRNAKRKVVEILTRWGISAYRKTEINELPVGLLKRYMIAQSLLGSPKIWILDEPTEGLDDLGRRLLFQELISSAPNRITLVGTKDMQLAECADNLMLLEHGACRRLGRKKFLTAGVPEGTVSSWYQAMQAFSKGKQFKREQQKFIP